jgi:hypothetical protein
MSVVPFLAMAFVAMPLFTIAGIRSWRRLFRLG